MARKRRFDERKILEARIMETALKGVAQAASYVTEDLIVEREQVGREIDKVFDAAFANLPQEIRDVVFAAFLSVATARGRKLIAKHEFCSEDVAAEVEANIAAARDARAASRKTQANDAPSSQA